MPFPTDAITLDQPQSSGFPPDAIDLPKQNSKVPPDAIPIAEKTSQPIQEQKTLDQPKQQDNSLRDLLSEDSANVDRMNKPGMGEAFNEMGKTMERYPTGFMKTMEDLQLNKIPINPSMITGDMFQNTFTPTPDKRDAQQIAQDFGKRIAPPEEIKDPNSAYQYYKTWGTEFFKQLPISTLGVTSEFLNPGNAMLGGAIEALPHVNIPAPQWVDNAIAGFIKTAGAPFSSLNEAAKTKATNAIVDVVFEKIQPRVDELKQNFKDAFGREATDDDIKAAIRQKLDMAGVKNSNLGQLAEFWLRRKMDPVLQPDPGLKGPMQEPINPNPIPQIGEPPVIEGKAPQMPQEGQAPVVQAPTAEIKPIVEPSPSQAPAPAQEIVQPPAEEQKPIALKGSVPEGFKPPILTSELGKTLQDMKEALFMGESPQMTGQQGDLNRTLLPSTNPTFYKNLGKGWTKNETINYLDKVINGEPVTVNQWNKIQQMADLHNQSPQKGLPDEINQDSVNQELASLVASKDITQPEASQIVQHWQQTGATEQPAKSGITGTVESTTKSATANTPADYDKLIESIYTNGGHIVRVSSDEITGTNTVQYTMPQKPLTPEVKPELEKSTIEFHAGMPLPKEITEPINEAVTSGGGIY